MRTLWRALQHRLHHAVAWPEVALCRLEAGCSQLFALFRNYTVVNPEKGVIEVERMSCPGMKLCCQLKFQNALWAATEVRLSAPCWTAPPHKGCKPTASAVSRTKATDLSSMTWHLLPHGVLVLHAYLADTQRMVVSPGGQSSHGKLGCLRWKLSQLGHICTQCFHLGNVLISEW